VDHINELINEFAETIEKNIKEDPGCRRLSVAEVKVRRHRICSGVWQESLTIYLRSFVSGLEEKDRRLLWWNIQMQDEQMEDLISGVLYDAFCTEVKEGYTSFYYWMKQLDALQLLTVTSPHGNRNTSVIVLRFDPESAMFFGYCCPDRWQIIRPLLPFLVK